MDNDTLNELLGELYNEGHTGDVHVKMPDGTLRKILGVVADERSTDVFLEIEQ